MRMERQRRIDGKMGDVKQGTIPFDGESMGDDKIDERVLLAVGQIAAKGQANGYTVGHDILCLVAARPPWRARGPKFRDAWE